VIFCPGRFEFLLSLSRAANNNNNNDNNNKKSQLPRYPV
jgi:hypothetical protein